MADPKIDFNLPISKNLKIIYGNDGNINSEKEAKMAESLLKFARPKESEDPLRLYQLKQSLENYNALGETPVLLHYTKKAYHYIVNQGIDLYAKFINRINDKNLAQHIR